MEERRRGEKEEPKGVKRAVGSTCDEMLSKRVRPGKDLSSGI